jgi:nitroreductase
MPFAMNFDDFQTLAATRTNVSARRLMEPGPDDAQLSALLELAASAPDHGQLAPWRFILVPQEARARLADAFGSALLERDANATQDELAKAREKAFRAPVLLIAIVRLAGDAAQEIPALERAVSFGAAIQNMLLGAHAMGFGAGLTSGKAMQSRPMRELCELAAEEHAVCCVNIGTPQARRGPRENRKKAGEIVRVMRAAGSSSPRQH